VSIRFPLFSTTSIARRSPVSFTLGVVTNTVLSITLFIDNTHCVVATALELLTVQSTVLVNSGGFTGGAQRVLHLVCISCNIWKTVQDNDAVATADRK